MRPIRECALEQRMLTADMIEHAIEHDTQSPVMGRLDERIKIGFITEPFVDLKMIDRVVTMRGRGDDRPKQNPGHAEIHGIIQPSDKMPEAMRDSGTRLAFGADKAERIDVPPDRPLDPVSQAFLRGMFIVQADRRLSRTAGRWHRRPAKPRSE